MRNTSNHALADALMKTAGGQHLLVQAKEARIQAYNDRVMRYDYLKSLVRDMFPKRRDIQHWAVARESRGAESRLWQIAGDEAMTAVCADKLKWAGTSEQAEVEAKLFINPPLK